MEDETVYYLSIGGETLPLGRDDVWEFLEQFGFVKAHREENSILYLTKKSWNYQHHPGANSTYLIVYGDNKKYKSQCFLYRKGHSPVIMLDSINIDAYVKRFLEIED